MPSTTAKKTTKPTSNSSVRTSSLSDLAGSGLTSEIGKGAWSQVGWMKDGAFCQIGQGYRVLAKRSGLFLWLFSSCRESGTEVKESFEVVSQGYQLPLQRCFGLAA